MRSVVKLRSQFPQSGETILALSLISHTIFDIIHKQFKCLFALGTTECGFLINYRFKPCFFLIIDKFFYLDKDK